MVTGFKFRKNRFLSFIHSHSIRVRADPSSTTSRTADALLLPSFGKEYGVPIELWVEPMFLYDRNPTIVTAGWADFCRFRLEKAYHYKMIGKRLRGEHEYVVCEFSYKDESNTKRKVFLQLYRSTRNREDDASKYLARDTIARLKRRPLDAKVLKSVTFSGDLTRRLSLCNFAVLASVVNNEKMYELSKDQQCYWFADAIFYTLEKWAEKHTNGEIKHEKNAKRLGTFLGKRVYERPSGEMSIWNKFLDEQREKDLQREQCKQAMENDRRRQREECERPLKQRLAELKQQSTELKERSAELKQQSAELKERSAELKQQIADLQRPQEEMKCRMDAMMGCS